MNKCYKRESVPQVMPEKNLDLKLFLFVVGFVTTI